MYCYAVPQLPTDLSASLESRGLRIEPATLDDLPELVNLVTDLLAEQHEFNPDETVQSRGIQLILESPSRGRIIVIRNDDEVLGMMNMLITISTALGGFVLLLEDVIICEKARGQGLGSMLLHYARNFAEEKNFKRITLLADRVSEQSRSFFEQHGYNASGLIPMRLILE